MTPQSQNTSFLFERSSTRPTLRRDVLAALITGQIAGLAMATLLVAAFTISPTGHWYEPPQIIASALLGERALGSFSLMVFALGLLIHQVISLGWSLLFALVFNQVVPSWPMALLVGLGIGLLGQLLGVQILLPWEMNLLHGHDLWREHVPFLWSALGHLVFGASFVLFVPVADQLRRADEDVSRGTRGFANPAASRAP